MISQTVAALLACTVISVTDGDTIRADCGAGSQAIRIADIDAPELRGDCEAERRNAIAARNALALGLSGGTVEVMPMYRDRYGRLVARLSVEGRDLGTAMVEAGLARPWPHHNGRATIPRPRWC